MENRTIHNGGHKESVKAKRICRKCKGWASSSKCDLCGFDEVQALEMQIQQRANRLELMKKILEAKSILKAKAMREEQHRMQKAAAQQDAARQLQGKLEDQEEALKRFLEEEEREMKEERERKLKEDELFVLRMIEMEQALFAAEEKKKADMQKAEDETIEKIMKEEEFIAEQKMKEQMELDLAAATNLQKGFGISVEKFTCICLDEFGPGKGYTLNCGHSICQDCFIEYAKRAIENREMLACPNGTCQNVTSRDVRMFLGNSLAEEYCKIEQKNLLLQLEGLWRCPTTDCPNAMFVDNDIKQVTCDECHVEYCHLCNQKWTINETDSHKNLSCEQYKLIQKADEAFEETLANNDIKRCKCGIPITKDGGCNQMSCTNCHRKWCWICCIYLEKPGDRCEHAHYH